jgi:hypothetical protein
MVGRDRSQRSSWIVNRSTGKPTGYSDEQTHPSIEERSSILSSPETLRAWLADPT